MMRPQTTTRALRSIQRSLSQPPKSHVAARRPPLRIPSPSTRGLSTTASRHHNPTPNSTSTSASTSTVDPTEVSHFNALASSWWDPHGPSRLLHLMNPLRHTFISQCRSSTSAATPHEKLGYLDIGCGGGIFAESAARLPTTSSVTAIDPTPQVLAIAEAHKRRDPVLMAPGKLTYVNTSIEQLPRPASPAEAFDVVTLFEVIEHVNAPGPFLEHVLPHVKPGGWLVMSTIARTWTSWVVTNVVAEDILGIVPKGTHEWSKYVNEDELRAWFAKQPGWGSVKVMGTVYVPGLGWKEVAGSEGWGNYFFAVRREG